MAYHHSDTSGILRANNEPAGRVILEVGSHECQSDEMPCDTTRIMYCLYPMPHKTVELSHSLYFRCAGNESVIFMMTSHVPDVIAVCDWSRGVT